LFFPAIQSQRPGHPESKLTETDQSRNDRKDTAVEMSQMSFESSRLLAKSP
jgi:hypothetical protein